jgi:hypothetical protein
MANIWDEYERDLFSEKKKKDDKPASSNIWDDIEQEHFNPKPKAGLTSSQVSSSIDRYQAGLYGVGEAVAEGVGAKDSAEWLKGRREENEFLADKASQRARDLGAVDQFKDVHSLSDFGSYAKGLAIQSLPYAGEALAGGLLARGAMSGTRAALTAAKEAKDVAGVARAERALNAGSQAGAVAASYPSAVGDVLGNQREQSDGETRGGVAAALAVPYAALNAFGVEGALARGTAFKNTVNLLDRGTGLTGAAARTAATATGVALKEGASETGQEMLNQVGRMSVDSSEAFLSEAAQERFKESFIGGAALGGLAGGIGGGWRRSSAGGNDISQAMGSKDATQPDITTTQFTPPPPPPAADITGTPSVVSTQQTIPSAPAVVGGTTDIAQAQAQAQAAQQQQQMQEQQQAAREEFTQRFGGVRPALDENGQPTQSVVFQNKTYHTRDELNAAVDKLVAKDQTKDDHARQVQAAFTKTYSTQEKTPNVNSVVSQTSRYTNRTASVEEAAARINIEIATLVGQGKKLDDTKLSKLAEFYENLTGVTAPAYAAAEQAQPTGVNNGKLQLQNDAGLREVPVTGGATETNDGQAGGVRPAVLQSVGATSVGAGPLDLQAGQPSTGGVRTSTGDVSNAAGGDATQAQVNGQAQATVPSAAQVTDERLPNENLGSVPPVQQEQSVEEQRAEEVPNLIRSALRMIYKSDRKVDLLLLLTEKTQRSDYAAIAKEYGVTEQYVKELAAEAITDKGKTFPRFIEANIDKFMAAVNVQAEQSGISVLEALDALQTIHDAYEGGLASQLGVEVNEGDLINAGMEIQNLKERTDNEGKGTGKVDRTNVSDLAEEGNKMEALMQQYLDLSNELEAATEANDERVQELEEQVAELTTKIAAAEKKEKARVRATAGKQAPKETENAVQVESTDEGDVREPAGGSETVGEGNAEPQKPARKTKQAKVEDNADQAAPEIRTPQEQYDALAATTNLLPPYEALDERERAQIEDQAYQGKLTLASLNTMFSGNAKFGKDVRAINPYTVAELTKDIEDFVRASISSRKLVIVNSVEDLTNSADKVVKQIGAVLAVEGAYGVAVNGRAFLIANRIEKGMGRAKFMHEVGAHIGLENLLPKATYDRLVAQIKKWTNSEADTDEVTLAARAEMRVLNANTPAADYDAELLAYFIEEAVQAGIDPTASGKETGALREWFRTLWAAFKVAVRKLGYNPEAMTAQDIVDMAFGAARLEMSGTYHGTAANFRNFRNEYIGSGEGATAYGWGTYLAERYGIAKGYFEADVRRKTKDAPVTNPAQAVQDFFGFGKLVKPDGSLMRVDTSVADDELFNYNATVAEQPQRVKDAIKSMLDPIADEVLDRTNSDVDELTGRDLFGTGENDLGLLSRLIMDDVLVADGAKFNKAVQQGEFHKAASLLLEEAGIAGIKHLDARSRGTATSVIQFRGKAYNRDELRDAARAAYAAKDEQQTFEMGMLRSLLQNGIDHVRAMHQSKQAYYERLFYKTDKESAEKFKVPFDEEQARADAKRKTKDLFETKALDWLDKHEAEISMAENPRTYNRILFSDKNIFRVGTQVAADRQRMRFGKNMSTRLNEGLENNLPASVVKPAKSVVSTMGAAVKNGLLAVGITEDVVNAASKYMRSAQDYLTAQYARQKTRLEFEQRIEAILDSFDKLPKNLQGEDAGSVNRYILDSTMSKKWGYYPGEKRIGTKLFEVDPDLEKRFLAFPPAAQQLIRDVFEHGYTALKAKSDAIDVAVEREFAERTKAAAGDADLLDEVATAKKLMRTQLSSIQNVDFTTPYAYLGRYGDYVVAAKSAEFKYWEGVAAEKGENKERAAAWLAENTSNPDHYVVQFAETQGEADSIAADLIATGKFDMDGTEAGPKEDIGSYIGSDVHLAVARLRNLISRQEGESGEGNSDLNRMISDLYLTTAAENSARKSEIMRKYVAGANGNMMRNLATSGRADAHFLSTMKHNDDVVDALERMRNEAKGNVRNAMPIYNELFKRQTDSLEYKSPSTLSLALTRATSVWFLATSPAFYLQQMLQTTVLSLPYMSGRLGYFRSARAIKAAYSDVATLVKGMGINEHIDFSKAPADVRPMLQTLVGMGKIDIGIDADAKARAGENNVLNTVMRKLQGVNNRIEAVNRATAAIAAYRGYIQRYGAGNTDAATKFAADVVSNTHGSYDGFNTPRVLNSDIGRLVGQFKRFQIIQLSMLGKLINTSFKGASPEERVVARRALAFITGHMAVVGGALGVPFVQQVASLMLAAFGDDDEPKNLEYTLRQAIGDETMANLLLNGVPAAAGVNLSGKLGMGNVASILPFTDVDLSTRSGYEKTMVGLMGPFLGGLAPKFADGAGMVAKGEYYKGLELLMPNGIGNAMKGARIANEGVTMRNGDVVLKPEEISMVDAAFQAVGLPTTTLTGRQYTQKIAMDFDKFYSTKAADIKGAYVNANRDGDTESMAEARKDWEDLQASRRKNGYKIQPMSELFKATVAARRREAGVVDGVETTKSNKEFVKNII